MALVRTTLTAAISASQLTFGIASGANAAFPGVGQPPLGYQPIMIDDEMAFLVSQPQANILTVRMRGSDGTEAVAHDIGSQVITSSNPADFPLLAPGAMTQRPIYITDVVTYGQSAAITVPIEDTIAYLNGTAALAMTLGAPSLALNGMRLTISSQSAFAHVIVATALFNTGGAGSPFTTATFPAIAGAAFEAIANNGLWNVLNSSLSPVVFS